MIYHPLAGTPFGTALELCVALAILCWILSLLTRDYSWVDRLWPVVPRVYCPIADSVLKSQVSRIDTMTVLTVLKQARLREVHMKPVVGAQLTVSGSFLSLSDGHCPKGQRESHRNPTAMS